MVRVDLLSRGRLTAGIGLGGWPEDCAASGVPATGGGTRLEATLETMTRVWGGEVEGQGGPTRRLPAGRPALLFGGLVPAAHRRATTRGLGWVAPFFSLEVLADGAASGGRAWAKARRPGRPRSVTGRYVALGPDAEAVAEGCLRHYYGDEMLPTAMADTYTSPARLREELDRLAEAGATDVVLHPCSAAPDQLTRMADAVGDPARPAGVG